MASCRVWPMGDPGGDWWVGGKERPGCLYPSLEQTSSSHTSVPERPQVTQPWTVVSSPLSSQPSTGVSSPCRGQQGRLHQAALALSPPILGGRCWALTSSHSCTRMPGDSCFAECRARWAPCLAPRFQTVHRGTELEVLASKIPVAFVTATRHLRRPSCTLSVGSRWARRPGGEDPELRKAQQSQGWGQRVAGPTSHCPCARSWQLDPTWGCWGRPLRGPFRSPGAPAHSFIFQGVSSEMGSDSTNSVFYKYPLWQAPAPQ